MHSGRRRAGIEGLAVDVLQAPEIEALKSSHLKGAPVGGPSPGPCYAGGDDCLPGCPDCSGADACCQTETPGRQVLEAYL